MTFAELGLSDPVLRAVIESGYTIPTPIQEQAIPVVLTGRDVLGCAQTGTGKTASFTLPMIEMLSTGRARARMPRSLILEPTRELAAQVSENFQRYGKNNKLSMALLIGGESFTDQQRALERGVDVLIATPGRLLDLFERGKILLSDVKVLVIDEADRMLDMGFIPDIERIVATLPAIRQTLFFSATMPPEIRRLAEKFLMNPKEISVAPPASPAVTVDQNLVRVRPSAKREALRSLLRTEEVTNAIVFCNRKRDVDILVKSLLRHGFDAAALHGDMPQYKRTETLDRFRNNELRLLVASDVAARGLDIVNVSHVFNFDVPMHAEDYIHRIGRTGRAGRKGRSITIASPGDERYLESISKLLGRDIPLVEVEGMEPVSTLDEVEDAKPRRRSPSRRTGAADGQSTRGARTRTRRESAPDVTPETTSETAPEAASEAAPAASVESARETGRPRGGRARPRRSSSPELVPELAVINAVDSIPEDRPESGRQSSRGAASNGGAVSAAQTPQPRSPGGRQQREPETPLGLGDHVPAFLLRPIPKPVA